MNKNRHFNFSSVVITLVSMWLAIFFYAFLVSFSGFLTIFDYEFQPWIIIKWITLFIFTPWVLLVPVVFYLANSIPVRPDNCFSAVLKHAGLMAMLALLHGYIAALWYYYLGVIDPGMENYEPWQHTGHFLFQDNMFLTDAFIYTFLVASQNIKRFYQLAQKNELNAARIKTQLAESRLQSLKMQINPHFLFNTLNSIVVLVRQKEMAKAEEMISRLSDFFRQTLEQGQEQFVPLKQELKLIEQYLEIEKVRFGERLSICYQIDSQALNEEVPVLILQPMVENSIKHGLSKKTGNGLLKISVKRSDTWLEISIEDDGVGTERVLSSTKGHGLKNVQSRLKAIYESQHKFIFVSSPDQGTNITICLPLNSSTSEGALS